MAVTDTTTRMQGLGTNPGLTLRAPDFCAQGAEVVTDEIFLGGKAVRGIYQGQTLMETGWLPSGTLNNIVLPTAYIMGQAGGTAATSYWDNLIVTVYKRPSQDNLTSSQVTMTGATTTSGPGGITTTITMEAGAESELPIETQEFTIHFIEGISDTIGALPNAQWVNRPSTEFLWFDVTYEYKFSVRVGRITNGAYLDLSALYLQFHTSTALMMGRQMQWSALQHTEGVPIIDGLSWGVTASSGGGFTVVLGSEVFDGIGGTGGAGGIQSGLFNSIEAVVTSLESASVYDNNYELKTYMQASETNGGFEVVCIGTNFGADSVLVFSTIILGHQTAREM